MVTITAGAANGLGVGQILLTNEQRYFALLYGWLSQFLALIAIGLAKVVIVLFLERIQGYHTRYRTFILWFLAGSNLIVNCIAAVLAMIQCDPVRKLWDEDVPGVCPGRRRIQIFGYIQGCRFYSLLIMDLQAIMLTIVCRSISLVGLLRLCTSAIPDNSRRARAYFFDWN